jgi:hypothetical protein
MTKAENVCPFTLSNDNPTNGKDPLKMQLEVSYEVPLPVTLLSSVFLAHRFLSFLDINVCVYQPVN